LTRSTAPWLISSIPVLPTNLVVPTVLVSRSTDDGQTWSSPVSIPAAGGQDRQTWTRTWTVCDKHRDQARSSVTAYTELDNFGAGDLELMSTSTDGGLTWSTPIPTAGKRQGAGAASRWSSPTARSSCRLRA